MTDRGETANARIQQFLAEADPRLTGVLFIDLAAIAANYRLLSGTCAPAKCAGVIKANAYGLGVVRVASTLAGVGCDTFFVATLREAESLKEAVGDAVIYVLDGLLPGTGPVFTSNEFRPVLNSLADVREWDEHCRSAGAQGKAAIQLDTGMTRLGLSPAELAELAGQPELLATFETVLVMSHVACADEPNHPKNAQQLARFREMRQLLSPRPASFANSAGVFLGRSYHFDLARPGIALYGGRAVMGEPNPMATVVHLYGRIVQVRQTTEPVTVGYGATHSLDPPRRLATVAAGYADGYPRHASASSTDPGATVRLAGHAVPVIGRISMDLIVLDVSDLPEDVAQRGGWVELLGAKVTVDDLADRAGTIGYEILTRLGRRYHRIYLD